MSTDVSKGLPVRTEDDADQYIRSKIFDSVNPALGAQVDADKNLHIEVHGNRADDAADVVLLLSEEGRVNPRGDYEVDDNSKPGSVGLILHDRNATPGDTHLLKRPTAITNGTVHAQDVALHHSDGGVIDASDPLVVSVQDPAGLTPVHDYLENDIAALGSANHDYSIADTKIFLLEQVLFDCSSRAKFQLIIGDGAASEAFTDVKASWFTKEDGGPIELTLARPIKVIGTVNTTTVRLVKENRDDDDLQTLYSTIVGVLLN